VAETKTGFVFERSTDPHDRHLHFARIFVLYAGPSADALSDPLRISNPFPLILSAPFCCSTLFLFPSTLSRRGVILLLPFYMQQPLGMAIHRRPR
jgi:hypothetical protein